MNTILRFLGKYTVFSAVLLLIPSFLLGFHGLWKLLPLLFLIQAVNCGISFLLFRLSKTPVIQTNFWLWGIWIVAFYLFVSLTAIPGVKPYTDPYDNDYYSLLAHSLEMGRLDLGLEPSRDILDLQDPYDPSLRPAGSNFPWDAAYYRGKYYIYFGITPVLTFFLPYHLITGTFLPYSVPIALFCSLGFLFSLGAFLSLLREVPCLGNLCLDDSSGLSRTMSTLAPLLLGAGNFTPFIMSSPGIYQVAVSGGFCFGMLGLLCLCRAWGNRDNASRASLWIASSGAALALAVGSRPNLLVTCILAAAVLIALRRAGRLSSRQALAFLIPYAGIGSILALYNFLRFGSVFEFGYHYTLTNQDLRSLAYHWNDLFAGFHSYLFRLPALETDFPYFRIPLQLPEGSFQHSYENEHCLGVLRLLPLFPLAFLFLVPGFCRSPFLSRIMTACLGVFLFLITLDSLIGIIARYLVDFLPYILIPFLLSIAVLLEKRHNLLSAPLNVLFTASVLWCVCLMFFISLTGADNALQQAHPDCWDMLKRYFS